MQNIVPRFMLNVENLLTIVEISLKCTTFANVKKSPKWYIANGQAYTSDSHYQR